MVTGKPPRHSKSTGEPVTIDLEADNVTPVDATSRSDSGTGSESANGTRADQPSAEAQPAEAEAVRATEEPRDEMHTSEPDASPPPMQRKGNSGLIAAGIFGGLVALAGTGAMQYAGFLPLVVEKHAPATDTSSLQAEIDALRQQIAALPAPAAPVADTALEGRIAALETAAKAAQATAGDPQAIAVLDEKVATLNSGLDQLKSQVTSIADTSASNIAEITKRLDEAETKLNEPRNDVEVARAVAVASLKAAIDRGGPFLAELDTLSGLAPDDPVLAGLKPYAATGVDSRADLMRQFPDAASAILAAIQQPDPDEGIAGRLMNSALSLVKVRPVGNVEGEGPDAVIARMEDKLKNGDLKGVALEWGSLPEAGQAAAAGFKTALDNRLKAEELIDAAMTKTNAATGNGG